MDTERILVTYATRTGSTRGVAEARTLEHAAELLRILPEGA